MEYKYGFTTKVKNNITFKKGINLNTVKNISKLKDESKYFLKFRTESFKKFKNSKIPN